MKTAQYYANMQAGHYRNYYYVMQNITKNWDATSCQTHGRPRIQRINLSVSDNILQLARHVKTICDAKEFYILGGALRDLYMHEKMNLPANQVEINDIDLFLITSLDNWPARREKLVESLKSSGTKEGIGREIEPQIYKNNSSNNSPNSLNPESNSNLQAIRTQQGLIEFNIPNDLSDKFHNAQSIQILYGPAFAWGDALTYLTHTNMGVNQIIMLENGDIYASKQFLDDMEQNRITINAEYLDPYQWKKTYKKAVEMIQQRPAFKGWKIRPGLNPECTNDTIGGFWAELKP